MSEELNIEQLEAKDYGIDKKQEEDLLSNLPQIKAERSVLIPQYDSVMTMDIEDPATSVQAKRVRVMIQKNRTQGINIWHKNAKDFFLKGGQFCDAIKRREVEINNRMEANLLLIEQHQEIKLEKAKKELQLEREKLISAYIEDASLIDLASMESDVFEPYLSSKKKAYNDKVQAEIEAEKERQEAIKAQEEEQERIKKENTKLKEEADERERVAKIEEAKRKELETEKEEAQRDEIEAEKEKQRKLQKELDAVKEAEEKELEEKERLIQSELNASDKDKVKRLISDLEVIKSKYSFKSKANTKMFSGVCTLIDKVLKYITNE